MRHHSYCPALSCVSRISPKRYLPLPVVLHLLTKETNPPCRACLLGQGAVLGFRALDGLQGVVDPRPGLLEAPRRVM